MFAGGGTLDPDVSLKLDVCAGIWKFGELYAKIGGGETVEVPLSWFNLCWGSYSSGNRGGGGKKLLRGGGGPGPCPVPGLGGKKSLPPGPGGGGGGNKLPELLSLL